MDTKIKLYLERAENKILLAKTNFNISSSSELKRLLKLPSEKTFFNDVISDAYYSIFYTAKSYLLSKRIITRAPEEHKKTYLEFEKLVYSGEIDKELLDIYKSESEKAEVLLNIFHWEKSKRGRFTYNVNVNANIPFARESLDNAIKFISIIKSLIEA